MYDHFMLKEICEQPAAVRRAITGRIRDGRVVLSDLSMTDREIRDIGRIYIVACGSSYHVGMVGKYTLERLLRRPVEVCLASEFRPDIAGLQENVAAVTRHLHSKTENPYGALTLIPTKVH